RQILAELGVEELQSYQAKWHVSAVTARKKLERLRTFFKLAVEWKWIQFSPAKALIAPCGRHKAVVPFSQEECEKLIWATELYPDSPQGRRSQIRAMVLLLRFSGLRIGDAIALRRKSLVDGKLFVRTQKTGTDVFLPLPQKVVRALKDSKNGSIEYY